MKIQKKRIAETVVIAVIVVLVILIVVQRTVGFGKKSSQVSMTRPATSTAAVNVEVKEMKPEEFIKTTNISGELEMSSDTASVETDVSGRVVEILVSKGQEIKKGDAVAVIDPSVPGSEYKLRTIESPFDGTVFSVDIYEGQNVRSGSAIAKVGNPGLLHLVLNIPEKYLNMVHVGTTAEFSTAAYPEKIYQARVSYVGKTVNSNTRTVETELEIENADENLLEGMFVKAKLITSRVENALVVPSKSLSSYLGNSTVYVVRDSHAIRTVVQTGITNDSYTVITDGLSEGDLVVIAGSATDSALVNMINR